MGTAAVANRFVANLPEHSFAPAINVTRCRAGAGMGVVGRNLNGVSSDSKRVWAYRCCPCCRYQVGWNSSFPQHVTVPVAINAATMDFAHGYLCSTGEASYFNRGEARGRRAVTELTIGVASPSVHLVVCADCEYGVAAYGDRGDTTANCAYGAEVTALRHGGRTVARAVPGSCLQRSTRCEPC